MVGNDQALLGHAPDRKQFDREPLQEERAPSVQPFSPLTMRVLPASRPPQRIYARTAESDPESEKMSKEGQDFPRFA